MMLIPLVVAILVVAVLYWAVTRLLVAFGVPEPIRTVVLVLFVLAALLWLVGYAGIFHGSYRIS